MSPKETGRKLTDEKGAKTDQRIIGLIAAALREDFGEERHAIKRISRATNIDSLNTVKAWYDGRNLPNFVHLIALAQHSPGVMMAILKLLGQGTISQHHSEVDHEAEIAKDMAPPMPTYTEQLFGINVRVDVATGGKLNIRQLWFLGLLQQGYAVKAEHIVRVWRVTSRTSESDIAKMVKANIIRFVGARKTGRYELHTIMNESD